MEGMVGVECRCFTGALMPAFTEETFNVKVLYD